MWWLPPGWDARQVVEAGRKAGVGVQDVAEFARKATPAPGVVIGYSAVDGAAAAAGALLAALRPRADRALPHSNGRGAMTAMTEREAAARVAASIYRHACFHEETLALLCVSWSVPAGAAYVPDAVEQAVLEAVLRDEVVSFSTGGHSFVGESQGFVPVTAASAKPWPPATATPRCPS